MDRRIGVQYFTIRDLIQTIEDFDVSCKKIKDIGYKLVQISGTPLPAKQMREVIKRMGKRAMAVHFKDLSVKRGENTATMYEIGEGNLNWDKIIDACEEAGVRWALVEQDECERDPFESLKISCDYLAGKGFC